MLYALVLDIRVGTKENPTYYSLGNHTETLQVDYDPTRTSFEALLEIFWNSHNPTRRPWSQQYKSALFYHNDEQKELATKTKERLAASKKGKFFGRKVFTEIISCRHVLLSRGLSPKVSVTKLATNLGRYPRNLPR